MKIADYISRIGVGRIALAGFLVASGIFFFVYGGYDDSPGGQGLGLLIAVYGVTRLRRKKSS